MATWLRSTVGPAVDDHLRSLRWARSVVASDWDGEASERTAAALAELDSATTRLDEDVRGAAALLEQHADTVARAVSTMTQLRAEALAAGLPVSGDVILRPTDPTSAGVFRDVELRAEVARQALDISLSAIGRYLHQLFLSWKSYAAFAAAVPEQIFDRLLQDARAKAPELRRQALQAEAAYLASRGGSAEARFQEGRRHRLALEAEEAARDADDLARGRAARLLGGRVPVLGAVVTVVGVGYDVHHGVSPTGAVVGAVAGTVGMAVTVAALSGPVGWVALAGVAVGVGASLLAEAAWEAGVPDTIRAKVDEGIRSAWHAGARGVSDLWGAIF